jgi:hypothetical protein
MTVAIYVSSLLLPSITVTIFQMFACINVDGFSESDLAHTSFLVADMSISCNSYTYTFGVLWAICMIIYVSRERDIGVTLFAVDHLSSPTTPPSAINFSGLLGYIMTAAAALYIISLCVKLVIYGYYTNYFTFIF